MEEVKLDVQLRTQLGSQRVKSLRQENDLIPGIVYGGGKKPTTIQFDRRAYEKIRRQHHGEVVFHLNVVEGEKKLRDYSAVVKEEQHGFVDDHIMHVDFKRISLKEKIEVKVPLVPVGEPVGVKKDGGSLDHLLWELDAVCLPSDIPEEIKVDVSSLEIGDSIHVRDIVLPAGVVTHHDPDAMVFTVILSRKEEELVEVDADAEPEVIGKDKQKAEKEAASGEGGSGKSGEAGADAGAEKKE